MLVANFGKLFAGNFIITSFGNCWLASSQFPVVVVVAVVLLVSTQPMGSQPLLQQGTENNAMQPVVARTPLNTGGQSLCFLLIGDAEPFTERGRFCALVFVSCAFDHVPHPTKPTRGVTVRA